MLLAQLRREGQVSIIGKANSLTPRSGFRHAIRTPGVYTKYGQKLLNVTYVVSLI